MHVTFIDIDVYPEKVCEKFEINCKDGEKCTVIDDLLPLAECRSKYIVK